MHELTQHKAEGSVNDLVIQVVDEPGFGGANHLYRVTGLNTKSNISEVNDAAKTEIDILFQNGPIPEYGLNGLTIEALLAICGDRLQSFQLGPFACDDNANALSYIGLALNALHKRTVKRILRDVEGKHIV